MADDRDKWADTLSAEPAGGWLTGLVAEEDTFDRRTLWRLGSWGAGAVAAVIVAVLASQSHSKLRREQGASAQLMAQQSQQIQFVAKETQNEARRLSQAIETLNGDRDRLYSRVTSIEQGLESVTGSIKRQAVATAPPALPALPPALPPATLSAAALSAATVEPVLHVNAVPSMAPAPSMPPSPPPSIAPVTVVAPVEPPRPSAAASIAASAPLMAPKSILAPPDATAARLIEPPSPEPAKAPDTTASVHPIAPEPAAISEPGATPVPRTEFGVDLGGVNSVEGLRALWRGLASTRELNGLRPVMIIRERNGGYGMQLRLIAGPLGDAAAAARLCAVLIESKRACETAVFDGQRLALKNDARPEAAPPPRRRAAPKQERTERAPPPPPAEEPAPPPKPASTLSSILGLR
ncbi:hypothetical protein FNL55_16380 [Tardiphaga sp. vice352]|uniref:hypothetical protein n=1 Tax=Tardiphaga sp. vice352 TaxID=2592816 RepID=UPI0011628426|nr:hypothetical protein [Tardiphaga sp. vice352]QDM32751.1 hypothetical protein FNL55_16380 [Tardiphaga sp. vice352]